MKFKNLKESIWALSEYLIGPIYIITTTPFLIKYLGIEDFGKIAFLSMVVLTGSLISSSIGTAVIKDLSFALGLGDALKAKKTITNALVLVAFTSSITSFTLLLLGYIYNFEIFPLIGNAALIKSLFIVGSIMMIIDQLDSIMTSALKGGSQFNKSAQFEILFKLIQIISQIIVVWIFSNIFYLIYTIIVNNFIKILLKFLYLRHNYNFKLNDFHYEGSQNNLRYIAWGLLLSLGALIYSVSDRFFISTFVGAAGLAAYSIALQLAQQIHALSSAACGVLYPRVSHIVANKEKDGWVIGSNEYIKYNFIFTTLLMLFLLLFNDILINIWLGKSSTASDVSQLFSILLIAYWLLSNNVVPHYVLMGFNKINYVAIINFIAGIFLLVSMYYLIEIYGTMGAGYSRLFYGLVSLIIFIPYLKFINKLKFS
jgi:O-antigen/teichoic acid export membrane protein